MVMKKGCLGFNLVVKAVDGDGCEGTAPKTFEPFEFVVFKTDELVLQFQIIFGSYFIIINC